jgi:hypothetical protein
MTATALEALAATPPLLTTSNDSHLSKTVHCLQEYIASYCCCAQSPPNSFQKSVKCVTIITINKP